MVTNFNGANYLSDFARTKVYLNCLRHLTDCCSHRLRVGRFQSLHQLHLLDKCKVEEAIDTYRVEDKCEISQRQTKYKLRGRERRIDRERERER